MKSAVTITYILLLMLLVFGVLSFFRIPAYEKGAWLIFGAIVSALSGLLGFLFGIHIPRPEAGAPVPNPSAPIEGQKGEII